MSGFYDNYGGGTYNQDGTPVTEQPYTGEVQDIPAGGQPYDTNAQVNDQLPIDPSFAAGMDWLDQNFGAIMNIDSPAATALSPAQVAMLGTDKSQIDFGNSGGPRVNPPAAEVPWWSTEGLAKMVGSLESVLKNHKELAVMAGTAATALLARDKQNETNRILQQHYASYDETAKQTLAIAKAKQENAQTSGANLNVKGLIGSRMYQEVPGGYAERRKRSLAVQPGVTP